METTAKEYLQLKNKLNSLGLFQMEMNLDQLLETVRTKEVSLITALNRVMDVFRILKMVQKSADQI